MSGNSICHWKWTISWEILVSLRFLSFLKILFYFILLFICLHQTLQMILWTIKKPNPWNSSYVLVARHLTVYEYGTWGGTVEVIAAGHVWLPVCWPMVVHAGSVGMYCKSESRKRVKSMSYRSLITLPLCFHKPL